MRATFARRLLQLAILVLSISVGLGSAVQFVQAQAPIVTPSGDPSVNADTIYKLAVDSKADPSESVHWLLDDGIVQVQTNGRSRRTFRSVMQILTEAGASGQRERQYGYNPGRQKLTINWVRVVRPNGSIVSAAPAQQQVSDVPAPVSANPVYGDAKIIRMSLSGVEPGTIVDASYTVEDTLPALAGDFFQTWRVTPGSQVERSRFIFDMPASMHPRIEERNLGVAHTTRTEGNVAGRTTYMWAAKSIAKIKPEAFAADSNGVIATVTIGSPLTWSDIGHWYAGLARDRYIPSSALQKRVAAVTVGARTRMDTIRAIHKWVAQDIRYVGIELGRGGYRPRMPDTVVATGFGDCKDKATLFVTALKVAGVTAYPVLLSSNATARRDFPGVAQFNHEIAVVEEPGGVHRYTDMTVAYLPYGILPLGEQGGFALVVHPAGDVEQVTLPRDGISENHLTERVTAVLSADGTVRGTLEQDAVNALQGGVRALFFNPLDSTQRASIADAAARSVFKEGHGDSVFTFNGRDFTHEPVVRVTFHAPDALTSAGDVMLLNLPFHGPGKFDAEAERKLTASPRRFPIDAARIGAPTVTESELRLTLPEGWHAKLPQDVVARGIFGSYEARYRQDGRELVVTHIRSGARGVYPPDRLHDLIEWLRAIGTDNALFIVLEKPRM